MVSGYHFAATENTVNHHICGTAPARRASQHGIDTRRRENTH